MNPQTDPHERDKIKGHSKIGGTSEIGDKLKMWNANKIRSQSRMGEGNHQSKNRDNIINQPEIKKVIPNKGDAGGKSPPRDVGSSDVAAELVVPVVSDSCQTPIMTIVLQILTDNGRIIKQEEGTEEVDKGEMTSAWRVISFFMVVFVLPTLMISIPLYARYHLYHAREMAFTDGDMASLHNVASTFWCQGQKLNGNGSFKSYLTKDIRRTKETRTSKISSQILLTNDDIEEWGFFLIKGSYFTFSTCSRWPGGTLLVVQGEDNMRRCFYSEEKVEEELNADDRWLKKKFKEMIKNEEENTEDEGDGGGGEVFEKDLTFIDQQIIDRIYSHDNKEIDKKNILATVQNSNEVALSLTAAKTAVEEKLKEELKPAKKKKKKEKKLKKKEKSLKEQNKERKNNIKETKRKVTKREISPIHFNKPTDLEGLLVNGGSLFFHINDTLDVTTGNSSFSSSEEFLAQCSDTIVSVDLMPFPDCSKRVSTSSIDSSITWKFRVNTTDYYYFIFTSDNSLEANVISFDLLLQRRLYDTSRNSQECSNSSECVFPFSFFEYQGVIVDFNEHTNITKLDDLDNYVLTVICQPRSAVYTVFILLVPFIIIFFAFR